ncbi:MAG: terminase large subunit domain-containing protein [Pseudoalteromonas tetraodonis]
MELTKPQTDIFSSTARFRAVVAGRRFGKTFLSTLEILRAAIDGKNKNVWYIAPTYGAAKEIAWDMLLNTIPDEYIAKSNETALTLRLINGSTIALKGAEKPNNLRGRALDFVVLDEFADMRPETWSEVIRASLSDRQGSALFIGTPKGRNHFYDIWATGLTSKGNWDSFQYTTLDGGNVPAEEIEQARLDLDERTFNQEYAAEFVTYSGLIYYAFSRELSVVDIDDAGGTLHIGMDFNLDPMSAVICLRHGQDLLAIDEIVMYGSNTDEMVAEIKERYPNRHIIIYPDPASRQRKTSAGGRTDLSILQNAGFSVKVKKQHPLVRDRINAVNSRLQAGNGERHLFVSPKCRQTIKSLERQTYKEGTSQPNKDGFDHMNDALGYLVEYMFPIRTEYNTTQPTRWT